MKILIIGGAGMIGRKLAARLAINGHLNGTPVSRLTIFDVVRGEVPDSAEFDVSIETGDLADSETAATLIQDRPDIVFHLAAVVSGEAEDNFDKGYRINLDGTRFLFDAIRNAGNDYCPRVVFTSSIAVFGAPFPEAIHDEFLLTPLTSYGTQKAICELLLADYSRRRIFDGVGIRLPTICVRPGEPNKAASGFFSNIIREPIAGQDAILPVDDSVRHWHASPRSAVGFLFHAANLNTESLGARRNLTMPGLSVTVGEQIAALKRVVGESAVGHIHREPDEKIMQMVAGWPKNFSADRAIKLGFVCESNFADIIRVHLEDDSTR